MTTATSHDGSTSGRRGAKKFLTCADAHASRRALLDADCSGVRLAPDDPATKSRALLLGGGSESLEAESCDARVFEAVGRVRTDAADTGMTGIEAGGPGFGKAEDDADIVASAVEGSGRADSDACAGSSGGAEGVGKDSDGVTEEVDGDGW